MVKNYDQKLSEQRHQQKVSETRQGQVERTTFEQNLKHVRFSTWLIDSFDRKDNTSSLLMIFPFPIPKTGERIDQFKQVIQDAFQKIFS